MKQLLAALVVILAVSVLAVAQDSTSARSTQSSKVTTNVQTAPAPADATLQLRQSRVPSQPIVSWHIEPGETLRLTPNSLAAGCYTMRIYRVARSERLQDGDTGRRGYATCEPGGDFQVRTATATDHPSSK